MENLIAQLEVPAAQVALESPTDSLSPHSPRLVPPPGSPRDLSGGSPRKAKSMTGRTSGTSARAPPGRGPTAASPRCPATSGTARGRAARPSGITSSSPRRQRRPRPEEVRKQAKQKSKPFCSSVKEEEEEFVTGFPFAVVMNGIFPPS